MFIDYKLIGRRVRMAGIWMDISQVDLAELVERSDSDINNIETAKSNIGLKTLVRIANALHVSADYLLGANLLNNMSVVAANLAVLLDSCTTYERRGVKAVIPRLIESLRANKGVGTGV